jgi:hypothetical protein
MVEDPLSRVTKGIFVDLDYSDLADHRLANIQSRQGQNSGLTVYLFATTNGTLRMEYQFPTAGVDYRSDPVVAGNLLVINFPYGIPQLDLRFQGASQPGNVKMEVVNY